MTNAQWTILGMLAVIALLDAAYAPASSVFFADVLHGQLSAQDALGLASAGTHIAGFLFGSFLLLWLATELPNISIAIAFLILSLVVLRFGDKIGNSKLINPSATGGK